MKLHPRTIFFVIISLMRSNCGTKRFYRLLQRNQFRFLLGTVNMTQHVAGPRTWHLHPPNLADCLVATIMTGHRFSLSAHRLIHPILLCPAAITAPFSTSIEIINKPRQFPFRGIIGTRR